MQSSAFKLSLGIVAPCSLLVPRSHGAGDPAVVATHAAFHANLNIILRIMALMLSTIRVLYALHTYELSTLMIEHEIRSDFLSLDVKLVCITPYGLFRNFQQTGFFILLNLCNKRSIILLLCLYMFEIYKMLYRFFFILIEEFSRENIHFLFLVSGARLEKFHTFCVKSM